MNGDVLPICKIVKRIGRTVSGYFGKEIKNRRAEHGLEELRGKIDEQNSEIIDLLKKRLNSSIEIAKIKKDKDIPVYDPEREKEILDKVKYRARKKGLDEKYIEKLFSEILKYSKERMRSVKRSVK